MTISINKEPGQRILELGGGSNPHPASDVRVDCRMCNDAAGKQCVDFTADFHQPLPIGSNEFDGVLSIFAMEHISYPKIPGFLKEVHRVLKPNGKAIIIVPNTEAQLKWIQSHPDGWDGKPMFESASCKLFGDQQHGERIGQEDAVVDSHKCYFDPVIASQLFQGAGFENIVVQPYGERATDMCVEAVKGSAVEKENQQFIKSLNDATKEVDKWPEWKQKVLGSKPVEKEENQQSIVTKTSTGQWAEEVKMSPDAANVMKQLLYDPVKTFNHAYFNGVGYKPFYWDFPCHEVTARHVLARRPESVIELGCGRGYVLKRLRDAGILTMGWDVSRHCFLTRVCASTFETDITLGIEWWDGPDPWDLCFSQSFFEHIPEDKLQPIFDKMAKRTRRGLHGITFDTKDDGSDPTRVTLKPKEWWQQRMPKGHEVVAKHELEEGPLPVEVQRGDGKVKLNIGCCMTMFHHGWSNIDCLDLMGFAQQHGYNYQALDVRQGLPHPTESVDMIFASHMFEHLSYKEGKAFLNDCRRAIKPDGIIRLVVPDAGLLLHRFQKGQMDEFDESNEGCRLAKTQASKLWSLLSESHQAQYDADTLSSVLSECGWEPRIEGFGVGGCQQLLAETIEYHYGYSLVVEGRPKC